MTETTTAEAEPEDAELDVMSPDDFGDGDGGDREELPGIWSDWRPPVWVAWVAGGLLVVVVVMLLFAGSGAPYAAKVNGETIPQSEFDAWMELLSSRPELGSQFLGGAELQGASASTWSAQSSTELLTILVRTRIVADAARRAGVSPSQQEIDESVTALRSQAESQGLDVAGLPDWFFDAVTVSQVATRKLVEAEVVRQVGAEEIARLQAESPEQFQRYDVEIVFGRTAADVQAFVSATGDAPWADSITPEQRQAGVQSQRTTLSLSSLRVASLQNAVRALRPGQVSPVLATEEVPAVAFRLIGTEPAAPSEVLSLLAQQRKIDVQTLLNAIVAGADVTVNPRLGRWSGEGVDPTTGEPASPGVVLPPAAPSGNGEVERPRDEQGGPGGMPPGVQMPSGGGAPPVPQ